MLAMFSLKRIFRCALSCVFAATLFGSATRAAAQQAIPQNNPPSEEATSVTLFPHSDSARWWVSGQANFIFQAHTDFPARYSGANSQTNKDAEATSRVLTLYLGYQPTRHQELLFNVEEAGGHSVGNALGVAGSTNVDVVRANSAKASPYIARVVYHYTLPLGAEEQKTDRGPLSLATTQPVRRLEFRFGKFSTADYFDANSVGSDSHLQFANLALVNNPAFDYAGDTRGYTYGTIVEFEDRMWGVRFGEMLMPKTANGPHLDADLARARAENIEFEFRPTLLRDRKTVLRALTYVNHANMGSYRDAVSRYLAHLDTRPMIENTRRQGAIKYGFGLNGEQELTRDLRAFFRLGWNEGQHESFVYTETDSTASFGADYAGRLWHRPQDKLGAAFVTSGISADHQAYLRNGGIGFILGDGALNYGREQIVEAYYTMHLWRGFFLSADVQHITNPGYNRDRGPITMPGVRLHLDL